MKYESRILQWVATYKSRRLIKYVPSLGSGDGNSNALLLQF